MKLEPYRKTMSGDVLHSWAQDAQAKLERYAEVLHDGYAVYSALTDDAKKYTTPENVSAVMDAFKSALANGRALCGGPLKGDTSAPVRGCSPGRGAQEEPQN